MKERIKEYIPLLLALTVLVSTVTAAIFVYYPISATVSPVQPPIVFEKGSNAEKSDLRGETIGVAVGGNGTSLSITVHPTYQVSYYKNLAVIKNTDNNNAYYVNLTVYTPISWTNGNVTLIVYGSGAGRSLTGWPSTVPTTGISQSYLEPTTGSYKVMLDLTKSSSSTSFQINASQTLEVDLLIYIPEGVELPSSATAQVYLVYSPVNETPP